MEDANESVSTNNVETQPTIKKKVNHRKKKKKTVDSIKDSNEVTIAKPATTDVPKKIPTPYELFADEGISKTGWAGLVVPLYRDIENWNKNKEDEYKFRFSQIKEKWGSLRLYNFGATEEQWERIKMCENASNHICMRCGSPFKVGKTQNGWMETICEKCAEKEDWYSNDIIFYYEEQTITPYLSIHPLFHNREAIIFAKDKQDAFVKLCERIEDKLLSKNTNTKTAETIYNTYNEINHNYLVEYVKDNFKLVRKEKYNNWHIQYDSVRITPVIKIALKLQAVRFWIDRKVAKSKYWIWNMRGSIKFLWTHYILRSNKMDNTLFNYHKFH